MSKSVVALSAALIAGWVLVAATDASAGSRHHGCCGGGPIPPTYQYKTKNTYKHITRYHDVSRTHLVHRTHRIVHVLRVRPVIHISEVTRVHHHNVAVVHDKHERVTQWLPPRKYVTRSVKNYWDCRCGS
jgi:hypothetical protein